MTPIARLRERKGHGDEHQSAVRAMFDRIAGSYDLSNRVMSAGLDVAWRRRAVRELRGAPEGALLDLCAGTMDGTALLVKERPHARVVACDFSSRMLDAGQSKAPRAEVVVGDALALPFEDAAFTGVLCAFGIRNIADPSRAAREARRVLAPRGVFVTLELFQPSTARARLFHAAYANHVLPAIGGILSGNREAYAYLARSMEGFVARPEYEEMLRGAGFGRVRGFDLTLGVSSIVVAEATP